MPNRLISRTLILTTLFVAITHSPRLFADYVYSEIRTHIKDESTGFQKVILVVKDTETNHEYRSDPIRGTIDRIEDFDGDGKKDALLSYNRCPGSACLDYYQIATLKNGKVIVADPEQSITNPTMVPDGKRILLLENMIDHGLLYAFDGSKIYVAKKLEPPKAIKEIRYSLYSGTDGTQPDVLAFDLNEDGHDERLVCEKDWAWGYYSDCTLTLPDGETASFSCMCRRIGVLPDVRYGYHTVIVDYDLIMTFDGSEWNPEDPQDKSNED